VGTRGLGLALVAWILTAGVAQGHGALQRAEPPVESHLQRPPEEVRLYFTERLEAAYSSIRVVNGRGTRVDRADGGVDRANPALLRARLSPLPSGRYTVIWRALSIDSHLTEGRFTFQVE
jgi:methionine-rich copper-binding protein CopC